MAIAEQVVETSRDELERILAVQRAAQLTHGAPSAEERIDRLDRCIAVMVDHSQALAEAMSVDFGHRSVRQSLYGDILFTLGPLKHARKHVRKWMRRERRKSNFPLGLLGARSSVVYQPLGVVGVIGPWNFPVHLTFAPLAGILAAGNRCMIKPSEYTPATSALIAALLNEAFAEAELKVVTGGVETGTAFSGLPFDHLLYTGGYSVARHVMRAAADHLVPVTLELGGKSPVIVGRSANVRRAATCCARFKSFNAGQICIAPDYALIPASLADEFVACYEEAVQAMLPSMVSNDDYSSIVNERHYQRLISKMRARRVRPSRSSTRRTRILTTSRTSRCRFP